MALEDRPLDVVPAGDRLDLPVRERIGEARDIHVRGRDAWPRAMPGQRPGEQANVVSEIQDRERMPPQVVQRTGRYERREQHVLAAHSIAEGRDVRAAVRVSGGDYGLGDHDDAGGEWLI